MSRVVIHFHEDGFVNFYIEGDNVRAFVVDDRAPGDRVYELTDRDGPGVIDAIIEGAEIGSRFDGKMPTERMQ